MSVSKDKDGRYIFDGPIWDALPGGLSPEALPVDLRAYWWTQRGLCPNCRNADNPPKCQPGGSGFTCPVCAWES